MPPWPHHGNQPTATPRSGAPAAKPRAASVADAERQQRALRATADAERTRSGQRPVGVARNSGRGADSGQWALRWRAVQERSGGARRQCSSGGGRACVGAVLPGGGGRWLAHSGQWGTALCLPGRAVRAVQRSVGQCSAPRGVGGFRALGARSSRGHPPGALRSVRLPAARRARSPSQSVLGTHWPPRTHSPPTAALQHSPHTGTAPTASAPPPHRLGLRLGASASAATSGCQFGGYRRAGNPLRTGTRAETCITHANRLPSHTSNL